jgi:nitrous oxidase accessory protein NosD
MVDGTTGNSGKSNVSVINTATGFAPASDLLSSFTAQYQWYGQPNPTSRTLAFKIGVQSAQWAASQSGFTATRSGESAWDLVLVHVPAASDNMWSTVQVNPTTGLWFLFRQAGNGYFPAPPAAKTLADWAADGQWGPILFGSGAKVTSIQFGLGSDQRQSKAYVDYLQTSLLNGGAVIDFAPAYYVANSADYTITNDADSSSSLTAGDTVVWNANGTLHSQPAVFGLVFGTDAFTSVQAAVNAAPPGATVFAAAGTYTERLTLTKDGTKVVGAGVDQTIIDYTGQTTGQGGVYITGNQVELRHLTVTHSFPNTASVPRYGIKSDFATGSSTLPVDGLVLDHVKVTHSFRTGIDLNGVTNAVLDHVSAINNGGAGIFITDAKGVQLSNITTSGNPWVGVSIATFGQWFPIGTNGIVFSGTNSFGESSTANANGQRNGGLQLEMGNFSNPSNPRMITWSNQLSDNADVTIQSADFGYMVSGSSFDNNNIYRRFYTTQADAEAALAGNPDHINATGRYVQVADDSNDFGSRPTNFYITAAAHSAGKATIQGLINAAQPGDTVNVGAGSFLEDINISKADLTVRGAGIDTSTIVGTKGDGNVTTVFISAGGVTFEKFTVTRDGNNAADWNNANGQLNNQGVQIAQFVPATVTVQDNKITGNRNGFFSQNGQNHIIRRNIITFNHTGIQLGYDMTGSVFEENEITNNRTAGVLLLIDAPGMVTSSLTFRNNAIAGNWYGGIVRRWTNSTAVLNFSGNWLGTTAPVTSTVNTSEPGYASLIPVAYGGSSTNPGGAPDIVDVGGLTTLDFNPFLATATDTNGSAVGFQGDLASLFVSNEGPQSGASTRINEAVATVATGGVVTVKSGTYQENVAVNKNLTLQSENGRASTTLQGVGSVLGTVIVSNNTTGVVIGGTGKGFTIVGIDNSSPGIESAALYFQGAHSGAQVLDNEIQANGDAGLISEFGVAVSGFVIDSNTFSGKTFAGANPADNGFGNQFSTPNVPRQLVVMGRSDADTTNNITFTNNLINGTAGGINTSSQEQGNGLVTLDVANSTITGNTFSGTTTRFGSALRVRRPGTTISGNTFTSTGMGLGTSQIFVQNNTTPLQTIVAANTFDRGAYVDGGNTVWMLITPAVNAAASGANVYALAGNYVEDLLLNKPVTLTGAGPTVTTLSGPIGGAGATVTIAAANVTLQGFAITREGNNVTDWNNAGLNTAGVAIQGLGVTNALIRHNLISGNRTGIDINNSNGHSIVRNRIINNRTGLIFRNQTDNLLVEQNEISGNWTVGILFLDASGGTNSPVQTAANSLFTNNDLSGNWYGQVVDRQTGGSLPAPGTTNLKNFSGNWFGTMEPVITTANSAEPGYAAQIPVVFGGSATAPGGQPDVAGTASANIDITPLLAFGTDTDLGTYGFQGNFAHLVVTWAGAQVGGGDREAEAASLLASGGTIYAPDIAVEQPAANDLTDGISTVDFSRTYLNTTKDLVFTVRNAGTVTLTNIAASIDGMDAADFTFVSTPATTLAPSASSTFTVRFSPTVAGTKSAALHITSNDGNETPFDIALSGRGAISSAALAFDGIDDAVEIAPHADFNPAGRTFTIEGWVKPVTGMPSWARLWGTEVNRGDLVIKTGSQERFSFSPVINGSHVNVVAPTNWTSGQWYHVAGVVDGSAARLYVDGVQVAAVAYSGNWTTDVGARYIGRSLSNDRVRGTIDEVRFWNYARNCDQIFQARAGELTGAEDGLVAYYKFNEGEASGDNTDLTAVVDSANDGDHPGTLVGFQRTVGNSTSNFVTPGAVTSGSLAPTPEFPEINVKGNGVTIANGDTTPSAADHTEFGTTDLTVTRTFTIENLGNLDLTVSSISLSGPDAAAFTVKDFTMGSAIAGSSSATFKIEVPPAAGVGRSATVTISSTDCDEGSYSFAIRSLPAIRVVTTGNEIVITDQLNGGGTINIAQAAVGSITVEASGRLFAVDNSPDVADSSGSISLTGKTLITINGSNSADVINIGPISDAPSITINGGTGNDVVNVAGDITLLADSHFEANLQDDHGSPGADSFNLPAGSNVVASGTGSIVVKVSQGVSLAAGSSLETVNGSLTVEANQQTTATTGKFDGVLISGGWIQATGTGAVTVKGRGGNDTGGVQNGVRVQGGGWISGGTTNALAVQGTGGASSGIANYGVLVTGLGSKLASTGGAVQVTGLEGGSASSLGIVVQTSGAITTTGSGDVTLIADSLNLDTAFEVAAGGAVTLLPSTNGTAIVLGPTANPKAGPLSLSDAELDRVKTETLTIGNADSGAISQSSAISRPTLTNMTLASGAGIVLGTGTVDTKGGNLALNPGGASNTVTASGSGVDINTGANGILSFGAGDKLAININTTLVDSGYTQLNVAGKVDFTGATLAALTGTHVPQPGQTFVIAKTDNPLPIDTNNTLAGLPEGATVPLNGVLLAISYVGGDGNDVTLGYAAPVLTMVKSSVSAPEGTQATNNGTFSDLQGDIVQVTASVGSITQVNNTWSWTYTPPNGPAGPTTVTITATDNSSSAVSSTKTFPLTVTNAAPVAQAQTGANTVNVLEDSVVNEITLTAVDVPADSLTYSIVAHPVSAKGALGPIAVNKVNFAPAANATGAASFTFKATDNDGGVSNTATVAINIIPVNDKPSFVKGADRSHPAGFATAQSVPAWATQINDNDAEAVQTFTFIVTGNDRPDMFATAPAVSSAGVLTYRTSGVAGTATISLVVKDSGGVLNGGVDTSDAQTFTITVAEDSTNPTVLVSAPAAGATVTTEGFSTVNVTGSATDNKFLSRVEVKLNGGAPITATLNKSSDTSGSFTAAVQPVLGTNTLVVTSFDASNNASTPVTRTFTYSVVRDFAVTITPAQGGTVVITPSLVSGKAKLGTTYSIKATPKTGYVFKKWSTSPTPTTGAAAENSTLVVTMTEDLAVTAEFMLTPFSAGTYAGLALPAVGTAGSVNTAGHITGTLTATGSYSAKLNFAGTVTSFTVVFNPITGNASGSAGGYAYNLTLDLENGTDKITGTVSKDGKTSNVSADRAVFSATNTVPSMYFNGGTTAKYNVVFPSKSQAAPHDDESTYPQGDGIGTLTLTTAGAITFAGNLADGTAVTGSAALSKNHQWPVAFIIKGTSSVPAVTMVGMVQFDRLDANSDLRAVDIDWYRELFAPAIYYPAGWPTGLKIDVLGGLHDPSMSVQSSLGLDAPSPAVNGTNGKLHLDGGGLTNDVVITNFRIVTNTVTKVPSTDASFGLSVVPSTGGFSGFFTPDWASPSGTKPSFKGLILQKGASKGGYGYFLNNALSGPGRQTGGVTLGKP